MRFKFPYFEGRPHIPVKFICRGKSTRFLPLLDSGADFSVFYKSDAMRIGLDWKKGKKVNLENADGTSFKARQFNLEMAIEEYTFKARICFLDENKSSIPLLGRKDIFEHFKITIHDLEGYVELKNI